ncbi:MAG: hypothetical protein K6E56_03815 [Lachnospiraceae bacterium]|nr:hypothetical protein [Lachnospiraceae bacterium]
MTTNNLSRQLEEMIKETGKNRLSWNMVIESTDDLDESIKEKLKDGDITWTVDECFVEYSCQWKGKDFCLISYEHVLSFEDKTRMDALVFLPPLGMRFFDINTLAPYAIKVDSVLANRVHILFETLMTHVKADDHLVSLKVIDPLK